MRRIAVFASGRGSNFVAIERAIKDGSIHAEIALAVCDNPGAPVIEKAKSVGIPTLALSPKSFPSKKAYEQKVLKAMKLKSISFIVLAGYMRLIGPTLLREFSGCIVNIHPSLLPNFPGLHAIEKAFEAGVKMTGVTIHFVDEGMDTGPILAQQSVKIYEDDTIDTLEKRIHAVEHILYPKILAELLNVEDKKGVGSHDKTRTHQCI